MVNHFYFIYLLFFTHLNCNKSFYNFIAVPLTTKNTYIIDMEYSPLVGGFGIILNDGRAALLTATSLKFDPNVRSI